MTDFRLSFFTKKKKNEEDAGILVEIDITFCLDKNIIAQIYLF